jgi:hypothetical protein
LQRASHQWPSSRPGDRKSRIATDGPGGALVEDDAGGGGGAVIAALIAAVTLVMLFLAPEYNRGVLGAAAWFLAGVAYFAFYARRRLILSPEEEFAMSHKKT